MLSFAQLIGLVISGSFAQTLGIRNLFFASAAMLALFAGFGYFRLPAQAKAAVAAAASAMSHRCRLLAIRL